MSQKKREILAVGLVAAYAILLGILHLVPRYDCLVFPLLAWTVFALLDGAPPRRLAVALSVIGLLFSFSILTHLWTTGHEGRSAVLHGIIPASDAGDFTLDAERIRHGLDIEVSGRRPLFVVFFGAALRWLANDLRIALVFVTALLGLSHGCVTWETMRAHGRVAGFFVFFVTSFWIRRFTGFVGTEDLAFPLGAVAFVLLVRSADLAIPRPHQAIRVFAGGMLCASLALVTRPGPLLVLPALLAWAWYAFRGRARLHAVIAGAAGIGVAFFTLRIVTARFAHGAAFNDFPNIAYALLHRCELHCAVTRHPELGSLPSREVPGATMSLILHDIANEPLLLLKGPLESFLSFAFGAHGWFGFVWNTPDDHVLENGRLVKRLIAERGYLGPVAYWVEQLGVRSIVNAAAMGFLGAAFVAACVVGLVRLVHRRRAPRHSLMLFAMLGSLGSSVFLPPWIGEGLQMHTGIFAFVPCAAALGLVAHRRRPRGPAPRALLATGLGFPAFVAVAVIAAVLFPEHASKEGCADDVTRASVMPSTRFLVGSFDEPPLSQNLEFLGIHNPDLVRAIRAAAHPGGAGALLYDACLGRTRIGFGDKDVLVDDGALHAWHLRATSLDRRVVVVTRPGEDPTPDGLPTPDGVGR